MRKDDDVASAIVAQPGTMAPSRPSADADADEAVRLLDSLMTGAPVGVAFFDAERRFVRVNETLAQIHGVPVEGHIGRRVEDVLPDIGAHVGAIVAAVLETNQPLVDVDITGATGEDAALRTWLANYYPIRDADGSVTGVGAVVLDVTDRSRAEQERAALLVAERRARDDAEASRRRLQILAESSARLSDSLDWNQTLDNVAGLLVPGLASLCIIDLVEDDRVRRAHVAFADPELQFRLGPVLAARPPAIGGRHAFSEAMRTRRTIVNPLVTAGRVHTVAADPAHEDAMAPVIGNTVIIVPLIARGRVLGAMTAVVAPDASREDIRVTEELCRRAALAIDNARLYAVERDLADALQRSLLPEGPLLAPGGDVAVRYLSAETEAQVGGDFYDLTVVGQGVPWVMSVGDVGGKGARAAAVMGQLRAATRAYALEGHTPAGVIRRLDTLFENLAASDFTTCVVASYDPVGHILSWANAGHLPPLLRRADGKIEWLDDAATVPLGLGGSDVPSEMSMRLDSGDLLVLYTDGLVERREEPIDDGLERLADALDTISGDVEAIATGVLEQLLREATRSDDIALLVFRAH